MNIRHTLMHVISFLAVSTWASVGSADKPPTVPASDVDVFGTQLSTTESESSRTSRLTPISGGLKDKLVGKPDDGSNLAAAGFELLLNKSVFTLKTAATAKIERIYTADGDESQRAGRVVLLTVEPFDAAAITALKQELDKSIEDAKVTGNSTKWPYKTKMTQSTLTVEPRDIVYVALRPETPPSVMSTPVVFVAPPAPLATAPPPTASPTPATKPPTATAQPTTQKQETIIYDSAREKLSSKIINIDDMREVASLISRHPESQLTAAVVSYHSAILSEATAKALNTKDSLTNGDCIRLLREYCDFLGIVSDYSAGLYGCNDISKLLRFIDDEKQYDSFIDRFPSLFITQVVLQQAEEKALRDIINSPDPNPAQQERMSVFLRSFPNSPNWSTVAAIKRGTEFANAETLNSKLTSEAMLEDQAKMILADGIELLRDLQEIDEDATNPTKTEYDIGSVLKVRGIMHDLLTRRTMLQKLYRKTEANSRFFSLELEVATYRKISSMVHKLDHISGQLDKNSDELIRTLRSEFDKTRNLIDADLRIIAAGQDALAANVASGFAQMGDNLSALHTDLKAINGNLDQISTKVTTLNDTMLQVRDNVAVTNSRLQAIDLHVQSCADSLKRIEVQVTSISSTLDDIRDRQKKQADFIGVGGIGVRVPGSSEWGGKATDYAKSKASGVARKAKKLFSKLFWNSPLVVYDFPTSCDFSVSLRDRTAAGTVFFPTGKIPLDSQAASPPLDIKSFLVYSMTGSLSPESRYEAVRAEMIQNNSKSVVYFASRDFVNAFSLEEVAGDIANAIVSGGGSVESDLRKLANVVDSELGKVAAFLEEEPEIDVKSVISQLVQLLLKQEGDVSTGPVRIKWVPVEYLYTYRLSGASDLPLKVLSEIIGDDHLAQLANIGATVKARHGCFAIIVASANHPTHELAMRVKDRALASAPNSTAKRAALDLVADTLEGSAQKGVLNALRQVASLQKGDMSTIVPELSAILGRDFGSVGSAVDEAIANGKSIGTIVDLRGTAFSSTLQEALGKLAVGNNKTTTIETLELDMMSLSFNVKVVFRNAHSWGSLGHALADAEKYGDRFLSMIRNAF